MIVSLYLSIERDHVIIDSVVAMVKLIYLLLLLLFINLLIYLGPSNIINKY